jgi:hypothetical protein
MSLCTLEALPDPIPVIYLFVRFRDVAERRERKKCLQTDYESANLEHESI